MTKRRENADVEARPAGSPRSVGAPRPRVLVLGSGFGGFFAARKLQRSDVDLTVLAATDGMLYQPLLPDVAVGALDPRAVVVPLATTLPRARIIRGHADDIDVAAKVVGYTDGAGTTRKLAFDRLLLAAGGVTRLLDIPGLADHAIGLKTVTEALYLRDRVLAQLELASLVTDPVRRRAALTFIVVGAGYAGVEISAQMARLISNLLPLHPTLHPDDVKWLLVDVADAVMPELGHDLGVFALNVLRERRVDVRLGTSLSNVTDAQVTLTDGSVLDCNTVIWCAGVTANPLVSGLDLPLAKGRLVVDDYLRVSEHPHVYAVGDAAAVPDLTAPVDAHGNRPLCPPTAQHAMRQANAAARNILADLGHGSARPYRHRDMGLVVDLGGSAAAATPLGLHLSGLPAKAITRGYHLYALPTAMRRIRVAVEWALAGRRPDDVSLGMISGRSGLIAESEDASGAA